jgi:hypothetical protein
MLPMRFEKPTYFTASCGVQLQLQHLRLGIASGILLRGRHVTRRGASSRWAVSWLSRSAGRS